MLITLDRQFLTCSPPNNPEKIILRAYLGKHFTQSEMVKDLGRWKRVPGKRFYVEDVVNNIFYLPITTLSALKTYFGYTGTIFTVVDKRLKPAIVGVPFRLLRDITYRPGQEQAVSFGANETIPRRLEALQPGGGKTLVANCVIAQLKQRVVIVIKPMYMDKWVQDVNKYLALTTEDILTVSGSKELNGLIRLGQTGKLKASIIIASNATVRGYTNSWMTGPDDFTERGEYLVPPLQFMETIGAGVMLVDEVHQDFHFNFMAVTTLNPWNYIALSGTLRSDDAFINAMQKFLFPDDCREEGAGINKYNNVLEVQYRFKDIRRLRTTHNGDSRYNHGAFEKSIVKIPYLLNGYLEFLHGLLKVFYMRIRQPKEKAMFFVASIDMATRLTAYFKSKYPALDIRRYVEDDPYENVLNATICVSTVLSAGTAVDVENLIFACMTINLKSEQSNLQAFHRTREIPGREVYFAYLICEQIPAHREYSKKKHILFREYAKTHRTHAFPVPIEDIKNVK